MAPRPTPDRSRDRTAVPLALAALDLAVGPALLLDAALRVVAASDGAAALLGAPLPPGASAPALLCGDKKKKPVADALAAGRPVQATIPRANDAGQLLKVRSLPLRARPSARPWGWLLLLEDAGDESAGPVRYFDMLSADSQMKQLFRLIARVAPDPSTVLIHGESGAGKELVARALHAASPRGARPLQAINCAALPPTLLEAELFGTVKGAYTGAVKDTPGLLRAADGGTLFLDEVAELSLELQAKLLRVLETREVLPVGGTAAVPVDVRVVSATHRDLRAEVAAGRFRADLLYRLRVIPLELPPLRDRPADIVLLARHFVDELNQRRGARQVESIAAEALDVLARWPWPGNVRELRNALQYAFALGDGPVLRSTDLPPELLDQAGPATRPATPANDERERLERALAETDGVREQAAARLGVSRVTLWRMMREHGLVRPRRRTRTSAA